MVENLTGNSILERKEEEFFTRIPAKQVADSNFLEKVPKFFSLLFV